VPIFSTLKDSPPDDLAYHPLYIVFLLYKSAKETVVNVANNIIATEMKEAFLGLNVNVKVSIC
jgi:hypothetical protein